MGAPTALEACAGPAAMALAIRGVWQFGSRYSAQEASLKSLYSSCWPLERA